MHFAFLCVGYIVLGGILSFIGGALLRQVVWRRTPLGRARSLLLRHLTPEQRKSYRLTGHVVVDGPLGRWRLEERGDFYHRDLGHLCVRWGDLPAPDIMLAAVLMIRSTGEVKWAGGGRRVRGSIQWIDW